MKSEVNLSGRIGLRSVLRIISPGYAGWKKKSGRRVVRGTEGSGFGTPSTPARLSPIKTFTRNSGPPLIELFFAWFSSARTDKSDKLRFIEPAFSFPPKIEPTFFVFSPRGTHTCSRITKLHTYILSISAAKFVNSISFSFRIVQLIADGIKHRIGRSI